MATPTDPLMTIGTFSRASLVSVKALRNYHDQGLLIPASIDPDTGYRSYLVSQLADAITIKRLRDLDLPLKAIARIVVSRDPEVTAAVVAEHQRTMQRRLAEVVGIIDGLHLALERPDLHTPVHVRDEPRCDVLAVSGMVRDGEYAAFLRGAFASLAQICDDHGIEQSGAPGAVYPPEVDREEEAVTAYVPIGVPTVIEGPPAGIAVSALAAGSVAVVTHAGGYDSIAETYAQLGAWVARNAISAGLPVREQYAVSYAHPGDMETDPTTFRTQILWPILPSTTNEEIS